jgi:preprotein translocase subunit YajC
MYRILQIGLIAVLLIAVFAIPGGCTFATEGEDGTTDSSSIWVMLGFFVVIIGLFYFVMVRPQQKRQKDHQQMMEELQRGDKVMTAGGIYGTIESISEDSVVLKVESGASLRVARSSVVGRREM